MWWLKVGGLRAMRKRNAGLSRKSSRLLKFAQVRGVAERCQLCLYALSARQPQLLTGDDVPVLEAVEGLQLHHQGPAVGVRGDASGDLP